LESSCSIEIVVHVLDFVFGRTWTWFKSKKIRKNANREHTIFDHRIRPIVLTSPIATFPLIKFRIYRVQFVIKL